MPTGKRGGGEIKISDRTSLEPRQHIAIACCEGKQNFQFLNWLYDASILQYDYDDPDTDINNGFLTPY